MLKSNHFKVLCRQRIFNNITKNTNIYKFSTQKDELEDEIKAEPPSFAENDIGQFQNEPSVSFNKSRLLPQHRRLLNEEKPYEEAHSWIHLTEKYQRKLYGRYGTDSRVNPRICFYTKKDLEDQKEYDRVAYPRSLKEMVEINKKEKAGKRADILKREEEIAKKLEKLEQWKTDLKSKIAKKEADALAAKERKERLIEEVRRHFGFKIDPRDERFKELLEQKEREDKKKQKEAKRKAKDEKMMAKLVETVQNKPEKVDKTQ